MNSLIVILIYGSLLLLSFLILLNPLKVNRKGNYWFGATIFLWSTYWIEEIYFLITGSRFSGMREIVLRGIQFFTPIIMYYSAVFFSNPDYRFRKKDGIFLILPAVYIFLLIFKVVKGFGEREDYNFILTMMVIIQIPVYITMTFLKIRKHQQKIQLFSSTTQNIDLSWLLYIIYLILSISALTIVYNFLFMHSALNLIMNLLFLGVIYSVAYFALRQNQIFPVNEKLRSEIISLDEQDPTQDSRKKLIPDEALPESKKQLELLMKQYEPYLDSELNLISLAEMMKITPHQLSYLLNKGFNENFFQFINRYRVEKSKELLLQDSMSRFSMLGIAFESGFNSKTSFNTTFKKLTGYTPSEFRKGSSGL